MGLALVDGYANSCMMLRAHQTPSTGALKHFSRQRFPPWDCWDCSEKNVRTFYVNQTRKTCLGEIFDSNNGALLQHQACIELRPGMYRASISHVSHYERPCFATRLGMFRNSIRYVLQRREWPPKRQANRCCNKTLIDRQLQKLAKNHVFAPNIFRVQKKRVVFNIDCFDF